MTRPFRFLPKYIIASIVGPAAISIASAHDIWLTVGNEAAEPRVVVNYGHPNDRPPPALDKLLDLEAITPGGTQSLLKGIAPAEIEKTLVLITEPNAGAAHALLAARYDNGFWVKMPDGSYRNSSKLNFPKASDSLWSMKFAKTVGGPDAPWDKIVGQELEIVPLANPSTIAPGGSLRVRLLFRGRPLSGVDIERGDGTTPIAEKDIPRFKTGRDGIADSGSQII